MKNKTRSISKQIPFMQLCSTTMKSLISKATMMNQSCENLSSSFSKSISTSPPSLICHCSQDCCMMKRISCRLIKETRNNFSRQLLQTLKYLIVIRISGQRLQTLTIFTSTLVLNFTWIQTWFRLIERHKTSWTG